MFEVSVLIYELVPLMYVLADLLDRTRK